jgi:thiamine-monophosphate kinase
MLTANTPSSSIAHLGETQLIQKIKYWLGAVNPPAPNGIGDDCAVLDPIREGQRLITIDSISYGHHFDDNILASDVGAKLIKRNLSDIAAMGGITESAVLALLCSPDVSIKWLENFFSGIRDTCNRYSISLVGGDVSALKATALSAVLTLNGYALTPKLRTSSQMNDYIYVTGTLGGSILGKHYQFEPRLAEGQWLCKQTECHAMMDLSDGLGKDLQALLPSGTSAHLFLDQIPISNAASELARTSGLKELEHAFCDGEDYELLFTIDKNADRAKFEINWKQQFPDTQLTCIGVIRSGSAEKPYLDVVTKSALPWTTGYEHLK